MTGGDDSVDPNAGRTGRTRRELRRSWTPWWPLFAVLVLALGIGALGGRAAASNEERAAELARTIKCPVCAGESVAESNAELSRTIREDIATRIEQGQTDEVIRDYYAGVYGDAVLLTPSASGAAGLVWILPVVVFAVAGFGLVVVFRRWGSEGTAHASDADVALVAEALARAHVTDVDANDSAASAETTPGPGDPEADAAAGGSQD